MQKSRTDHPPNLGRLCLSLSLVAAVMLTGCGGKRTPAPQPATSPTGAAESTSAPTTPVTKAPITAQAAVLGSTISMPSGGSILVPEGALPRETRVDVAVTQMPLLPDDVEPVGEALAITASAQPAAPVTLRLPVPAGIADPEALVILRVEPDGATTFLMTEVDGLELVASTPGFSTFSIGALLPETKVGLTGISDLIPGQREMFYPRLPSRMAALWGVWRVTGPFTLVHESSDAAVVQAGDTEGLGHLTYSCQDQEHGRRWFGSRVLTNRARAADFTVSAITHTPMVHPGDKVRFTGSAYGEFTGPLTWTWDFGNGAKGEQIAEDAADRHLELPLTQYDLPQDRDYHVHRVKIVARDAQGREAFALGDVRVTKRVIQVALDGPERVTWSAPVAIEEYAATASGGSPPYVFTFRHYPGSLSSEGSASGEAVSRATLKFDQPGGHLIEVTVTDRLGARARAVMPIRVAGEEHLSTRLIDLPAKAAPGAKIALSAQVRGGVLVVAGKKSGYTVRVSWGDGAEAPPLENVGATTTPQQGLVVPLSHAYGKPGKYTIRVQAFDAAGAADYDEREITITDTEAVPSPSAAKTNTPPATEDITTSTTSGAAVAITLKGTDADGDSLTYTYTRPTNGSLSGTLPFLTYTPKMGFSGTDTFTYRVRDGQADSRTASVTIVVEGLQWVRVGEPLLNATDPKERLEYYGGGSQPDYFGEERFLGKFTIYRVSETLIAMDDREVDRGYEYWNVSYESRFDAPPPVLTPGEVVTLTVKLSASGSVTEGMPPTVRFQFGSDKAHRGSIQPDGPVGYNPWFTDSPGVDAGTWTLTVPQGRAGDTFEVWAGWWNCAMCNVTWTYSLGVD